MGFWLVHTLAICPMACDGAVASFGERGLPCGLRRSLGTRPLCRAAYLARLDRCNTREAWLVRPYAARTLTLQEAPSFAWRTNGLGFSRRKRESHFEIVTAGKPNRFHL